MRLTFYLMFASVLQVAASAYSQSNLSIEANDASVKEIFATIQAQSGYRFFYSDDHINLNQKISVSSKDLPVEIVMADISEKAELNFKILEDKLIVISPSDVQQTRTITGTIVSEVNGSAIPGINVVIKDTNTGTITDLDGKYSIEVESNEAILVFSFVGFVTEEVTVGNQSVIDVVLIESIESLEHRARQGISRIFSQPG